MPLGSLARSLAVIRLFRNRWVHLRASGCRWVHPGSLGSLARVLAVVGFIQSRWVHSHAREIIGFIGVGFTRALPVGCWVDLGSLGSLAQPLGVV